MSRSTHDALLSSSCAVSEIHVPHKMLGRHGILPEDTVDLQLCQCLRRSAKDLQLQDQARYTFFPPYSCCLVVDDSRLLPGGWRAPVGFLGCKFLKPRRPPMTPKSVCEFRHNTSSATSSMSAADLHHIRHPSIFPIRSTRKLAAVKGFSIFLLRCRKDGVLYHQTLPPILVFLSLRHAR